MALFEDLLFFDKSGTQYNFDYDVEKCVWSGSIHIDKVSRGLFETQKILLVQRYAVSKTDNEITRYEFGYPSLVGQAEIGQNIEGYVFEWDNAYADVGEINLFKFDGSVCPPEDTSSLTYFEYNCPRLEFCENVLVGDMKEYPYGPWVQSGSEWLRQRNANYQFKYAEVNICFCNSDSVYNTFRRRLKLYYVKNTNTVPVLVGEFDVYAESVEEDERLTTMCDNLGYRLTNDDFKLFKQSDIKEQVADFEFVNLKRKEILTEGHNIYPYIGTYKSLVNVIRFYGYDNLAIREWWKNVDVESKNYGRYFLATSYSLTSNEVVREGSGVVLPSRKFRKTNKITLAWNIDRVDAGAIKNAPHFLPPTVDAYEYTIEEAVIKLYGFRRKLEKEYLPLNAHIVDVVGEALGFDYSVIRTNVSDTQTHFVDVGQPCDFDVLPSDSLYIEDLRPFGVFNKCLQHLPHGVSIVGETVEDTQNVGYIGDSSLKSLLSVKREDVKFDEYSELGLQHVSGYNTNLVVNPDDEVVGTTKINVTAPQDEMIGLQGIGLQCAGMQRIGKPINIYGSEFYSLTGNETAVGWNYYEYALHRDSVVGNYYLADFSRYFPNLCKNSPTGGQTNVDIGQHLPDGENIPVGALLHLKCKTKTATVSDMLSTWDDATYIWDVLNYENANQQRISWTIYKGETDTPTYLFNIVGTFADGYGDICVSLPYVGTYSIKQRVFGYDNSISENIRANAVEVLPKTVEFTGWYKTHDANISWEGEHNWDFANCEWDYPCVGSTTWDDMKSATYESMDRATFSFEYFNADDPNSRMLVYNNLPESGSLASGWCGPYFWNNMDVEWRELEHLSWANTVVAGDVPCYFEIGGFDNLGGSATTPNRYSLPGNILEVVDGNGNYGCFVFPTSNTSGFDYLTHCVLLLNKSVDPVISRFRYSKTYYHNMGGIDARNGFCIMATAKRSGTDGDYKHVGIVTPQHQARIVGGSIVANRMTDMDLVVFSTKSQTNNPTWNNVRTINGFTEIDKMTDVCLNYTNCGINGKTNPRWVVKNANDDTMPPIECGSKNFHYMFKNPGCYSVELTLSDTNGNTYSAERKMFKVV